MRCMPDVAVCRCDVLERTPWDHLYIVGRSREELGRLCANSQALRRNVHDGE